MLEKPPTQDKSLTLNGHLLELRKRMIICTLSVIICTVVAFIFHPMVFDLLMGPAKGFESLAENKLVFTQITEMIGITMKVSIMGGMALSIPIILYQMVLFISPGLTSREKKYLFALLPGTLLSFVAGCVFGYLVLLPPALNFLMTFGSDIATPMIRVGNYINLVINLLFWLGVCFQTPLVMFFLSKIGIVHPKAFAKQRRIAIVAAFILGAIITPTFDPVNQSLVAIPIIILYELGILLSKLARLGVKDKKEEKAK